MSIDAYLPPIVRSADTKLRALLDKARTIKQTIEIEPPLQPSDFEEAATISTPTTTTTDATESSTGPEANHTALETSARNIFYELLSSHSIDEPDFVQVWNLLDLLQICANHKQCDASLALWLIEELLDSQTINGCRRVFDFLESRRERLITKAFSMNKQMIVLRSCNELLRRLSRAEDAVFCGRVFIFLFQSFPLGDKSSVNLRGEFHVENTTKFDALQPKSEPAEEVAMESMEIDAGVKPENDTPAESKEAKKLEHTDRKTTATDDAPKPVTTNESTKKDVKGEEMSLDELYTTFWSLQDIFSNPKKVFNQNDFEAFKSGLDVTLKKFKTVPKVLQAHSKGRNAESSSQDLKRKRDDMDDEDNNEENDFASTFNPKYLTSRDLFELELSDLTFQRHILVQALILIEFLLSLTPKAKKKLAELNAQRAMVYDYTLSDDDAKWANSTRTLIATYLQSLPGGSFHHRMVSTILARDKNWVRWKIESCPPISRPPVSTESLTESRDGAKRMTANRKLKQTPMGAIDVDFLSDAPDSGEGRLESLKCRRLDVETGKGSTDSENTTRRERQLMERQLMEKYIREIENIDLDLEIAPAFARLSNEEFLKLGPEEKKEFEANRDEHDRLVSERSSRTWRLMRLATRNRMDLLSKIDESKTETLKILLRDDGKRSATAKDVKATAEANGVEDSAVKRDTTTSETKDVKEEESSEKAHTNGDVEQSDIKVESYDGGEEDTSVEADDDMVLSLDGASDSRPNKKGERVIHGAEDPEAEEVGDGEEDVLVPATQQDAEMADAGVDSETGPGVEEGTGIDTGTDNDEVQKSERSNQEAVVADSQDTVE